MNWIDRPIEPPKARVRGIHRRVKNRGHARRLAEKVEINERSAADWQLDEHGNLCRVVANEVGQ